MAKKDKRVRPSFPSPAVPTKTPKVEMQVDFNDLKPAWRVSLMEMRDPYGWHAIEKDKITEIHIKLGALESLTWKEILVARNYWNHRIQKSQICKTARDRLTELQLDDVDELISLRLSSTERVWGFQQAEALTLLWWDPGHQVYPTFKRNT